MHKSTLQLLSAIGALIAILINIGSAIWIIATMSHKIEIQNDRINILRENYIHTLKNESRVDDSITWIRNTCCSELLPVRKVEIVGRPKKGCEK